MASQGFFGSALDANVVAPVRVRGSDGVAPDGTEMADHFTLPSASLLTAMKRWVPIGRTGVFEGYRRFVDLFPVLCGCDRRVTNQGAVKRTLMLVGIGWHFLPAA